MTGFHITNGCRSSGGRPGSFGQSAWPLALLGVLASVACASPPDDRPPITGTVADVVASDPWRSRFLDILLGDSDGPDFEAARQFLERELSSVKDGDAPRRLALREAEIRLLTMTKDARLPDAYLDLIPATRDELAAHDFYLWARLRGEDGVRAVEEAIARFERAGARANPATARLSAAQVENRLRSDNRDGWQACVRDCVSQIRQAGGVDLLAYHALINAQMALPRRSHSRHATDAPEFLQVHFVRYVVEELGRDANARALLTLSALESDFSERLSERWALLLRAHAALEKDDIEGMTDYWFCKMQFHIHEGRHDAADQAADALQNLLQSQKDSNKDVDPAIERRLEHWRGDIEVSRPKP